MAEIFRASDAAAQSGHNPFGRLPEWDLSDLYPGRDSPVLLADVERAKADAKAFETDCKGNQCEHRCKKNEGDRGNQNVEAAIHGLELIMFDHDGHLRGGSQIE